MATKKQVVTVGQHKINDRAMLVGLNIRLWQPHTTDQKVTKEVAENHNSDRDMGKYRKRLLPRKALQAVWNEEWALRREHALLTLPWSDGGYRILNGVAYFQYNERMSALIQKFNNAYAAFRPTYEQHKKAAKAALNGLYDEADYPTLAELDTKFSAAVTVKPIPGGDDFRVDLGSVETAKIRKQIEAETKATIEEGMKDAWGRLRDVVQHASERLKAYTVTADGKVQHTFRDTLVTNITDLLDIVPILNVTGSAELNEFAERVRKEVAGFAAEQLRSDDKLRKTVADKADVILKKMEAYL